MRIVFTTIPLRSAPTDYPPFGVMALIKSLRNSGYEPVLYDIDAIRPTFEEAIQYLVKQKPDVIGISAVVSTGYDYVKKLTLELKKKLPDTPIVLGGNLAASAELLLRRCGVDICVIGEGERTIIELVKYFEKFPKCPININELRKIKNLSFLDEKNNFEFTGYDLPIPVEEFLVPDFSILEEFSKIECFVTNPFTRWDFSKDPRSHEPHRKGKKMVSIFSAKGCVARCTFCHRWDKGYRHLDPKEIINRMKELIDKYNIGFFCFADENFGSDKKKLLELIRLLKPLNILYIVGGVRVRSVNLEILKEMKESGCVAVYYGMETGSPKILKVMEKNATLEMNLQAARWTYEAGLYTVYQLVLAMPGENKKTIDETIDFIKKSTEYLPEPPHKRLSTNYIQALPGTPVYEYARQQKLIGPTMDDEEKYLTIISDTNACDDSKFINFTDEDYLTVQSWRRRLLFEVETNYYKKRNWEIVVENQNYPEAKHYFFRRSGYFNFSEIVHHPLFYRYFQWLKYPYLVISVLKRNISTSHSISQTIIHIWEWIKNKTKKKFGLNEEKSLRRVVKESTVPPGTKSEESMTPLRLGR